MDDDTGQMSIDPAVVWRRSPITREGIERVIAAAGYPCIFSEGRAREALLLAFAKAADVAVGLSLLVRPSEPSRRAAAEAFIALMRQYPSLVVAEDDPMPSIPPIYAEAMASWAKRQAARSPKRHRTQPLFEEEVYPEFLDLFRFSFDERATATAEGPAVRFMRQLHTEILSSRGTSPQVSVGGQRIPLASAAVAGRWAAPGPDALRRRIQRALAARGDHAHAKVAWNAFYHQLRHTTPPKSATSVPAQKWPKND